MRQRDHRREDALRARQVSGLLILGGILLAGALVRARWQDLFPTGWWHVW